MNIKPFALERWDAHWEHVVAVDLGQSSGPTSYLSDVLARVPELERDALLDMSLGYGHSLGVPRLRALLAERNGGAQDEYVVTTGATEAIYLTYSAIAREAGNVVVVTPCYQSLASVPRSLGLEVREWGLRSNLSAPPSLEELAGLVDSRTRAVVVNFPHNPTGIAVDNAWMLRLVQFVDEHGSLLVSDEVYRPIVYAQEDLCPPATSLSARCVSIGDFSKPFGMGGLRVGWIHCPDAAMRERLCEMRDYTTISPSTPAQAIASLALVCGDALIQEKVRVARANQLLLKDALDSTGLFAPIPRARGGFVLFPKMLHTENTDGLCETLARDHSINIVPGSCFGHPSYVRVHFGLEEERAQSAFHALAHALSTARSRR